MGKNTDKQSLLMKLGFAPDPVAEAVKEKAFIKNVDRIKNNFLTNQKPLGSVSQSSTYVVPKQKLERSSLPHRPDGSVPVDNIPGGVNTYMVNPQADVRDSYSKSGLGLSKHINMLNSLPSADYNNRQAREVLGEDIFNNIQAEKKSIANPSSDYMIEISQGSSMPKLIGAGGFYHPATNKIYLPKHTGAKTKNHEMTHARNYNSGLKTDYNFNGIPDNRTLERILTIASTLPGEGINIASKLGKSIVNLGIPKMEYNDDYYLSPTEIAARISPAKQEAIKYNEYNGLSSEKDIDNLVNDLLNDKASWDDLDKVAIAMKKKYGDKDGAAKFRALFKVIVDNKGQQTNQTNSPFTHGMDIS